MTSSMRVHLLLDVNVMQTLRRRREKEKNKFPFLDRSSAELQFFPRRRRRRRRLLPSLPILCQETSKESGKTGTPMIYLAYFERFYV